MRVVCGVFVLALVGCGARSGLLSGAGGSAGTGGSVGGTAGSAGSGGAGAGGFGGAGGSGGAPVCPLRDVVAGGHHTCARFETSAYCWGANQFGQVGDASTEDRDRPTLVESLFDVAGLGSGDFHSCAMLQSGDVRCWGHNALGALGDGTYQDSAVPTKVKLLLDAVALSQNAVTLHSCAVKVSGDVACWGDNSHIQLGTGGGSDHPQPVPVSGLHDALSVATGYLFSCAGRQSGGVTCWGWNANGALGFGVDDGQSYGPFNPVVGLSDAVQVVAGNHYACALHASGGVSCWGYNGSGQLGVGDFAIESLPVPSPVVGLNDAVFLAGGESHVCAVRQDGSIVCWGRNFYGQLGDGSTDDRAGPVVVQGIGDATRVAAGGDHTCAESASRGVVCWGANFSGQLGDGSSTDAPAPVSVLCPSR